MQDDKSFLKPAVRYSEAFKMEIVRELESQGVSMMSLEKKYGISGRGTIRRWLTRYGNGSRGKVILVQKPEEIDELKRLKERVRRLEGALADANVDLAIERAYTRIACKRAGISDVDEFKKKNAGQPDIKP